MVHKLIKSEGDYSAALARIERLMDAVPGTPDADELELLATLVELYEDSRFPMSIPSPTEAIKFRLEQLGLNRQDLVPLIGSRSKVSEVLSGKTALSMKMVRALHEKLGIPADLLVRKPESCFPADLQNLDWERFPLKEMARRGLIEDINGIKSRSEDVLRPLIDRAGGLEFVAAVLFRREKSPRQNTKTDAYALWAWCLQALTSARRLLSDVRYLKGSLTSDVLRDIAKLSFFVEGPILAREYLKKLGVILVVVPHFPKTYLDGASFILENGTPVVAMTLRHDRADNFWFCLIHELVHIARHLSDKNDMIVDDLDLWECGLASEDPREREADQETEKALVSDPEIERGLTKERLSTAELISLARHLRVHPAVVAGRIRHRTKDYRLFSRHLGRGEIRERFAEFGKRE